MGWVDAALGADTTTLLQRTAIPAYTDWVGGPRAWFARCCTCSSARIALHFPPLGRARDGLGVDRAEGARRRHQCATPHVRQSGSRQPVVARTSTAPSTVNRRIDRPPCIVVGARDYKASARCESLVAGRPRRHLKPRPSPETQETLHSGRLAEPSFAEAGSARETHLRLHRLYRAAVRIARALRVEARITHPRTRAAIAAPRDANATATK